MNQQTIMLALFMTLGVVLVTGLVSTPAFSSTNENSEEQANKAWDKVLDKAEEGKGEQSSKAFDKTLKKCDGGIIIEEEGVQCFD
jgi:Na+-translocating ferredoxin:NAD+ oxidoreductase RnfG subunit